MSHLSNLSFLFKKKWYLQMENTPVFTEWLESWTLCPGFGAPSREPLLCSSSSALQGLFPRSTSGSAECIPAFSALGLDLTYTQIPYSSTLPGSENVLSDALTCLSPCSCWRHRTLSEAVLSFPSDVRSQAQHCYADPTILQLRIALGSVEQLEASLAVPSRRRHSDTSSTLLIAIVTAISLFMLEYYHLHWGGDPPDREPLPLW